MNIQNPVIYTPSSTKYFKRGRRVRAIFGSLVAVLHGLPFLEAVDHPGPQASTARWRVVRPLHFLSSIISRRTSIPLHDRKLLYISF
jgi:hypothetical protein